MTPELRKIIASKQAMRRKLAGLPVAEKLRLLDMLRERTSAIAEARQSSAKPRKNSAAAGNFFRDGLRSSIKHLILL